MNVTIVLSICKNLPEGWTSFGGVMKFLITILLSLAVIYSQQYQAKNTDKINVFIQPNDSTLAYYGSLDVNKDNVLNWEDYNKMVAEAPLIDEADLNGDGIPSDPQDIQIAADYLNRNIEYIPAQWNKLETREERIDWLDKMLAIDQTDTITYSSPDWISGDFGAQTSINFGGIVFENQEDQDLAATKFDTTNNCRFNIPVYHSSWSAPGIGHGQNSVNVEYNSKNPEDYVYPDQTRNDQYNDLKILGENWNPRENSNISVDKLTKPFENSQGIVRFYIETLVTFKSGDNSILNLYYQNPNLIETREQAMDTEYPLLTVTTPQQDSTYNTKQTPINFTVIDDHFDRIGYSLNEVDTTWLTTAENSFEIQSVEGGNVILIIAEDKAGNQTLEEIHYTADANYYVSIEDDFILPTNFKLYQNYPNPFNPSTTIQFTIPQVETLHATSLQLKIYNINGKEIAILEDNVTTAGSYTVEWNAKGYPSGIYFYQLQNNLGVIATKKMLLLR